jgi:hypothetical protein
VRALEIDVKIHVTAGAVRWLFEGVAADAYTDQGKTKTVRDFIRAARCERWQAVSEFPEADRGSGTSKAAAAFAAARRWRFSRLRPCRVRAGRG